MAGATGISAGTATLHGTPACAVIVVVLVGAASLRIGAPVGFIRIGAMLGFGTSDNREQKDQYDAKSDE